MKYILIMIQLSFWNSPPTQTVLAEYSDLPLCEKAIPAIHLRPGDSVICAVKPAEAK